jgi:hypothetical protein
MNRTLPSVGLLCVTLVCAVAESSAQVKAVDDKWCRSVDYAALGRNPNKAELRCRFGVSGPGRFGLLSYADVPVYQPATPMPGTHLIGVPGQPRPQLFETFEQWEWRVLRTKYSPEVLRVNRGLETLDPVVRDLVMTFEARLAEEGVRARRRETWRAPQRQAYLFQQGRSRPGKLATTTLTSWHSHVDSVGAPSGRAVDYDLPASHLRRFHQIAHEVGLESFGAESNDPGHVFLPKLDAIPAVEIAVLRTIPRIPEVTLSTGLPVDEALPPGGHARLRSEAVRFASLPFIPFPVPRVALMAPSFLLEVPDLEQRAPIRPKLGIAVDNAAIARSGVAPREGERSAGASAR